MLPRFARTLVHAAADRLRSLAADQARRALSILAPVPVAPPPELPRMDGPELARHRIGEAATALLGKGVTPAEAFRLLRLELNRLEQGGARL
jgi:hypothetical protein